jgi:hypothetical protein
MTSAINPQNIDGAYPVAGQDNDSQGFRDNFTNIKTNFTYAAEEITDLQSKAVLKAALTGTVLNNDMGGSILNNAQLQNMSETRVALGPVSGSQTINYNAGPYYTLTTAGSVSLQFTNFPAAGTVGRCRVRITVANTAHTLTLPSAVSVGTNNIQGINLATNVITFNIADRTYEFEFETNDGGTSYTIIDQNRNLDPIYLPSAEDLANTAAANLSFTSSYVATGATGETATLAAGATGQVKVFALTTDGGGDMVITVTNPAWGGAGTITLADVGDACTLMYINSKWVCIGNNGCVFA